MIPNHEHAPAFGEPLALIAERDPRARDLESVFLQQIGFVVQIAGDGAAAWELIGESTPQLVVTEILLPKLDGLALCRRIKGTAGTQHILVLVISILAATSRAFDAGADGFLLKPLSQEKLLGEVSRLVPLVGQLGGEGRV